MTHNWPNFVTHTRVPDPYSGSMESHRRSPREKWNDGRMDEFARRTEQNFSEVRGELGKVREEIKSEASGLRAEMNGRFASLEASTNRRFDILFAAVATGFVAAIVQHFIG